jgi:hypothetical protein
LDDVVAGLLADPASPLFTKAMLPVIYPPEKETKLQALLGEAAKIMSQLEESPLKHQAAETIEFLVKEARKPEPESIVFQGMLSNLKGVRELSGVRKEISKLLNISLL